MTVSDFLHIHLEAHYHFIPAVSRGGLIFLEFGFKFNPGEIIARDMSYSPPLALTVISSISIGVAVLCSLWILVDIGLRRGWKSMMAIMIPVYVINALYLWPITLWTYLNYGRPAVPREEGNAPSHCAHSPSDASAGGETEKIRYPPSEEMRHNTRESHEGEAEPEKSEPHDSRASENQHEGHDNDGGHGHGGERPMFATITVAVCHCGAGCVLGDVIGEWLVYGTRATIHGRTLWPAYLIEFAFAIAFGIVFQYFSIAPMAGEYGAKTLYRAAKADFLSLAFFEIGLFGWMAMFQIAIFQWELEMNTITYWWMMQIGMFLGHWTSVPINWWLIKANIKEPCA